VNRFGVFCRRVLRTWGAVVGVALLASCGGSGEQVEPFVPTRVVVFGDEQSLLLPDGRKYSINAINSTTNLVDCALSPVWTQSLAASFGIVFPGCPGTVTTPQGLMHAAVNAKVADVAAQIDAHLASDGFSRTDLVTVFVGLHDLLDLYAQFPARARENLILDAKVLGEALARQVNRIALAGGRTLFVTVQDLGRTPFALAERTANPGAVDRAQLLTDLTDSFNDALKFSVINDGRFLGQVAGFEISVAVSNNAALNGFNNATVAACRDTVPLLDCTSNTLITDANNVAATAKGYFWADATHLSSGANDSLSSAAQTRARGNPF
jgi:outer membrane lipase/esterase